MNSTGTPFTTTSKKLKQVINVGLKAVGDAQRSKINARGYKRFRVLEKKISDNTGIVYIDDRVHSGAKVSDRIIAGFVQFGRGVVRPVTAKALRMVINGSTIFRKFARASKPKPFWGDDAVTKQLVSERIKEFLSKV